MGVPSTLPPDTQLHVLLNETLQQLRAEATETHAVVPADLLSTLRAATHTTGLLARAGGPQGPPAPAVVRGGYWSAVVHGHGGVLSSYMPPPTLPLKRRLDNAMAAVAQVTPAQGPPVDDVTGTPPVLVPMHHTPMDNPMDTSHPGAAPTQLGGTHHPFPGSSSCGPQPHMSSGHAQLMDSLAARLKRVRREDAAYEEWLLGEAIRGDTGS